MAKVQIVHNCSECVKYWHDRKDCVALDKRIKKDDAEIGIQPECPLCDSIEIVGKTEPEILEILEDYIVANKHD